METQEASGVGSLFKIALPLTIPVAALFYGTGLVAANLTFSFVHFSDANVSHQICIETGILFWILFVLAILPAKIAAEPIGRAGFSPGYWKWIALFASWSLLFVYIWYPIHSGIERNVIVWVFSFLFTLFAFLAGWLLNVCLSRLYSALENANRKHPADAGRSSNSLALRVLVLRVPEMAGAAMGTAALFVIFCYLNLGFPPFLGGIGTGETTIWLTSDAVPVLKSVNARIAIEPKGGLVRLDNVNVLHVMNDRAILFIESASGQESTGKSAATGTATIEIPLKWFKAERLGITPSQAPFRRDQNWRGVWPFLIAVALLVIALSATLYLKHFWSIADAWW